MPTGYTAALYDGKDQTFPEFAMNCARAFGALVELRDSPEAEIPDEFEPSDYHVKAMAKAEKRLAEAKGWTDATAMQEADADYMGKLKRWQEARDEREGIKERYTAMIAEVEGWEPPTPDHRQFKDFMLSQLREALRFDCGFSLDEPQRQTGAEFRQAQIDSAWRDLKRHRDGYDEDVKRARERTEWVGALRDSLEGVVA